MCIRMNAVCKGYKSFLNITFYIQDPCKLQLNQNYSALDSHVCPSNPIQCAHISCFGIDIHTKYAEKQHALIPSRSYSFKFYHVFFLQNWKSWLFPSSRGGNGHL